MVVNFRTQARFRGLFVESPSGGRAGEVSSMVMSVDHPGLTFNLTSVRSEPTYNQPVQQWTFTSDFAVRSDRSWKRFMCLLELQGGLLPLLLPAGERLLRNVHGEAGSLHGGPAHGAHGPAHLQPQRTDHI